MKATIVYISKKLIEVEILCNCNFIILINNNFIKCNFNKSVNFNLQYYSNVVGLPTDSCIFYSIRLVERFFSLRKFGMYCTWYISKIIDIESNRKLVNENQIVKFVSKPSPIINMDAHALFDIFWTVEQKHPPTAILTLGRARIIFNITLIAFVWKKKVMYCTSRMPWGWVKHGLIFI